MKILFLIGQLSNGGAERVVSILATAFSKDNDVMISTLISPEIAYKTGNSVVIKHIDAKTNNKFLRITRRLAGVKNIIKGFHPDVIISFTTEINIYSIIANKRLRVPLIISERNDPNNDPPSRLTRKIRDYVYKWADGYVFQTPDAKKYFDSIIHNISTVIPNPVKDELPYAMTGQKENKIVTVSRLYPQKNIPCLIKAFKTISDKFPDYRLEIYGDGPLKEQLKELTKELDIDSKVSFEGFCENVHERIKNAKLFVLASDYEGMSNAMIEALAMGMPTICTDCPIGGARMLINDGINGILVPVNNSAALAGAMDRVLSDDNFRRTIASQAMKIRNDLSTEVINQRWMQFVREVLLSRNR